MNKANRRLRAVHRTIERDPLPASLTQALILPDDARLTLSLPSNPEDGTHVVINDVPLCAYKSLARTVALVISAVGTPFENSAHHIPKYPVLELLPADQPKDISIADFWAVIYSLFNRYHMQETIPILITDDLTNRAQLESYVIGSGIGRRQHAQPVGPELFLSRTAFWQGGGTNGYHMRGWLPPKSSTTIYSYAVFPTVQSFTRNSLVIAAHPLRPPKPQEGEVLYRRFCPMVGQMLEFTHFNLEEKENGNDYVGAHLDAFHRWHNDERVNRGWGEKGSMEKHRKYVREVMNDPSVLPVMMSWDGELMGYLEIVWIKENHVSQYIPGGTKDWDRGIHVLVGEDKFRGYERAQSWYRSLHQYCFLADPRTETVVAEPKSSNTGMVEVSMGTSMHVQTLFDFPYKRSALMWNPRERFFKLDML
ncbi:hypothetical protein SERLA73DRAFT_83246 [Serpula lacrymans var. lacrymans S7.3]|uniref:Acyltransferase MbtK/IucB-like conserved domain-containing protein n=2 Tax=Serpula lacrymans var. lacrymans TaxID=341189 RepID=F8PKJ2_SERL3|nr:putative N-acyltransferase [Serpula lacrymans var. lacrymans S7.9]EGO03326.1 hypothetical protein SERLA73DRAFT_83246 [Serpula lacrymans var. lacrymans S7.3]EGO29100.1 putative N-acyltransferase [Serpula lacrymans var. lacrymans S7.9]